MTEFRWQIGVGVLFLLGGLVQLAKVLARVLAKVRDPATFTYMPASFLLWSAGIAALNLAIGAAVLIYALHRRKRGPNA